MKQKYLILFILLLAYSFANCQIITFSGKNSRNDAPVTLDSILIQNILKHKDTVIKDYYFNLSGATGIGNVTQNSIPFSIEQNYPNSFDDETQFTVNIPKSGFLAISLINYLSETITSFSNNISEGRHEFLLSGGNFPSGAYFIISSLSGEVKAIKIMKAGSNSNSPAKIEYVGNNDFKPMVFDPGEQYNFIGHSAGFSESTIIHQRPFGGEKYEFSFNGFKPEITNIIPNNGCIGMKVKIAGKYFISDTNRMSVYFGDRKAIIVNSSSDTIIARVPENFSNGFIRVVCPVNDTISKNEFNVMETKFSNFVPKRASPGDTITITGSYFLPEKESINIKIGNASAVVVSADESEIKAIIPDEASSDKVIVQFFSVKVESQDSIVIPSHRIYSFSPKKAITGAKVIINGKKFGFDKNQVKVFFGTKEAEITNIQDTLIETTVPEGLNGMKLPIGIEKDNFYIICQDSFAIRKSSFDYPNGYIILKNINLQILKYEGPCHSINYYFDTVYVSNTYNIKLEKNIIGKDTLNNIYDSLKCWRCNKNVIDSTSISFCNEYILKEEIGNYGCKITNCKITDCKIDIDSQNQIMKSLKIDNYSHRILYNCDYDETIQELKFNLILENLNYFKNDGDSIIVDIKGKSILQYLKLIISDKFYSDIDYMDHMSYGWDSGETILNVLEADDSSYLKIVLIP